jgi:hypothetical protein
MPNEFVSVKDYLNLEEKIRNLTENPIQFTIILNSFDFENNTFSFINQEYLATKYNTNINRIKRETIIHEQ